MYWFSNYLYEYGSDRFSDVSLVLYSIKMYMYKGITFTKLAVLAGPSFQQLLVNWASEVNPTLTSTIEIEISRTCGYIHYICPEKCVAPSWYCIGVTERSGTA